MQPRPPLPPIRFAELAAALLQSADALVPDWLPEGTRTGHEWRCADLRGGKGESCSVNLRTGAWADFATDDKGGDLIGLYAAMHGLSMGKAAVQLARAYGLEDVAGVQRADASSAPPAPAPPRAEPAPAPAKPARERWESMTPVPNNAPRPTFQHWQRPTSDIVHTATYQRDGALLGYTVRFVTSDGGKDILPYTFCRSDRDGGMAWRWKQWQEPRPLYLPGGTSPGDRIVVLVEGEKKADALQAQLDAALPDDFCVVSWPGGCKAWRRADWSWLAGADVLLWPDCDAKHEPLTPAERSACTTDAQKAAALAAKPLLPAAKQPGMRAMLSIGALLATNHDCRVQLLPIPEPGTVADGWDCDDAITTDGWDAERTLAFFDRSEPLPAPDERAEQATGNGPAGAGGGSGGGRGHDDGWPEWLRPYWDADKRRWMVSRKLVIAALRHDVPLQGMLAHNELSSAIDVMRQPPWRHGKAGPMGNGFDLALGGYLSDTYGMPAISRQALMEGIEAVAAEQHYHPVRNWLRAQTWDGTPRLDKWLIYVLGQSPDTLTPALAEYLRQVGRFWLLGMVYRAMQPGCQFDYCPVLEGKGGLRKSTLVKVLTGEEWFSATHMDLSRGKEAEEQVRGLWGYEFAEMAGMSKTDVRLIKSFISRSTDRYRPAYGRVLEAYPRQVVLMGTTNDKQYLRDRTGNRRFWPVPVTRRINIDWVERMRGQLFAEAVVQFDAGARFFPTPADEDRLFVPMQESRVAETAISSELLHVLTRTPTMNGIGAEINNLTMHASLAQLVHAVGVDPGKSTISVEQEIRSWMDREGWQYKRKRVGDSGARAYVYVRPDNWPPQTEEFDMEADVTAPAATPSPADEHPSDAAADPFNPQDDDDDVPF